VPAFPKTAEQFLQNDRTCSIPQLQPSKAAGLFRTADGKNYAFLFLLVTSLFLLWGVCNGMIDVLNKHFQDSLHINKMQSALVQFANYMGYFFMAIPSGITGATIRLQGRDHHRTGAWLPQVRFGSFPQLTSGLTGRSCWDYLFWLPA
jgi:hypothetical protein